MSAFRLHDSTATSPSIRGNAWQSVPNDQQSKASDRSVGTVHRASDYRPPSSSARSLGSDSSARLRIPNENLMARRNASHSSLMSLPYTANPLLVRGTSKQASHRSSWADDSSPAPHEQRVSRLLAETGPLEDIDLNAGCGESLYSRHETRQGAYSKADRGLSFDIRKQETLSTPRLPSSASRKVTEPRSFSLATQHSGRSENPVKRLFGTLRTQGLRRRHSLTPRKERWILDDFDEAQQAELELPQGRQLKGHQKASSWSSSGIRHAIKSATAKLQAATNRPHSPMFSRARLLRSNKGSRISNSTSRVSMDGDQVAARAIEQAAWDRAVQRRRILDELVSSEESYVADLKVLIHVGGLHDFTLPSGWLTEHPKVYLFMLSSAPKGPQATQPEISQNVADILRLHEDILREIKALMQKSQMQLDATIQWQSKHRRWYSVESTEAPSVETPVKKAWPTNDFPGFGIHKDRTLVTTPREAAEMARMFERMV